MSHIAYADWVRTNPASHYPGYLPEDLNGEDGTQDQRRDMRLSLPTSTVDAYNQGVQDAFRFASVYMHWLWTVTHAPYQPSDHSSRMTKYAQCCVNPPAREAASDRHDRECKRRAGKWGF